MFELSEFLRRQRYSESPHFYDLRNSGALEQTPIQGASLFRQAQVAGLQGVYTFATQPEAGGTLWNRQIAVGLARTPPVGGEQEAEALARQIHKNVWNLGGVPFLVVVLPHQVRLYSGFSYAEPTKGDTSDSGLLDQVEHLRQLRSRLAKVNAEAIDSGEIWQSQYSRQLDPEARVDRALLRALQSLGHRLREEGHMSPETSHSLIGKYIYLRYLRDRGILTDALLQGWRIRREDVFGRNASRKALARLVAALEERFNGKIFPLALDRNEVEDFHVRWASSAILGDKDDQIHLPFQPYDFKHIPVEVLSIIYEQFLRWDDKEVVGYEQEESTAGDSESPIELETKAQKSGVVYTPVFLADYVLAEAERIQPLEPGMRVLDPACGSGVFLVLAYRRLIERRRQQLRRDLTPPELKDLLTQSIFGVEREAPACAVAEFSLLLTLLHYCDPPDLLGRKDFQFPSLRGVNIIEANFFEVEPLPEEEVETNLGDVPKCPKVDLVLGNPPWIELSSRKPENQDEITRSWIEEFGSRVKSRITGNRVAEAFSQCVTKFLQPGGHGRKAGVAALLLPATSLFNAESMPYRKDFFAHREVLRITDFANLREVLFGRRTEHPAVSIIYRERQKHAEPGDILHLAPLGIHQLGGARTQPWALTIYEDEICAVPYREAESGESVVWKLALWGTSRDAQALRRLKRIFPTTLEEVSARRKGWTIAQGPEFRSRTNRAKETLTPRTDLLEHQRLDSVRQTASLLSFSAAEEALVQNTLDLLRRGRNEGLALTRAPHVIISPRWFSYLFYSDLSFIVPARKIGLAAPPEDADLLRALSIFLSSSLAAYHLFFNVPEWGTFRRARYVTLHEVKRLPVPDFSPAQVRQLAALQKDIARQERTEWASWLARTQGNLFESAPRGALSEFLQFKNGRRAEALMKAKEIREELIELIDTEIFKTFKISRDLEILIREWRKTRLPLDRAATAEQVTRQPSPTELCAYAQEIQQQLDSFVTGHVHHRVTLAHSPTLVECKIEQVRSKSPFPIGLDSVQEGDLTVASLLKQLSKELRQKLGQWVYVQRGLRLFEGDSIYIYKPARLIDWTCTQAMIDATEIIGAVVVARTQ